METKILKHDRLGEVRYVTKEGGDWYVARDICRALGLKNVSKAAKRLPDSTKAFHHIPIPITSGAMTGIRKMLFLNAEGVALLCDTAFSSCANEIKQWLLADEVPAVPQVFNHPQFGDVRIIEIDGEAWLVGKDAAAALGYSNPQKALRDHVTDKFKRTERIVHPSGGLQDTILINEAGMYKLVMRSKLPTAEKFSDWVCAEVLPAIRKTGSYTPKPAEEIQEAKLDALKAENAFLRNQLPRAKVDDLAVVYVLLMSNGTVKIGQTDNLPRRIKEIERETNLYVFNFDSTKYLTREQAQRFEKYLQGKFSDQSLGGEFFSIRFIDATAEVGLCEFALRLPAKSILLPLKK